MPGHDIDAIISRFLLAAEDMVAEGWQQDDFKRTANEITIRLRREGMGTRTATLCWCDTYALSILWVRSSGHCAVQTYRLWQCRDGKYTLCDPRMGRI